MLGRILGWVSASVLVLALIAYGFVGVWLGDRLPQGTRVLGVDVSQQTYDEASVALASAVERAETTAIPVTFAGHSASVTPREAGLSIDLETTLAPLFGATFMPQDMWERYRGEGAAVSIATSVDTSAAEAATARLAAQITDGPVNGKVELVDGALTQTPPANGESLLPERVASQLHVAWQPGAAASATPVALDTMERPPAVTQAVMDAFAEQVEAAWAQPVHVTVEEHTFDLTPEALKAATTITPTETGFTLGYNGESLREALVKAASDAGVSGIGVPPVDATLDIVDGQLVATGGKEGTGIDPALLAQQTLAAVGTPERTAAIEITPLPPRVTEQNAPTLGIKELVSSFSTNITADSDRTHNLETVAGVIDQQVVLPGETFSMNDTAGPYSREQGYRAAGIISGGVFSEGVGGGVSQMGTTLYNAAFFAGLEDVEHRPHTLYISRYPEGREATISSGQLDVKFKNDTDTAILMKSWVANGKLTVEMWGTKHWDITTTTSERYNFRAPRTVESRVANCQPNSVGMSGFSVDVVRNWHKIGDPAVVRSEKLSWTYDPTDRVRCLD
ncbi:VanW family protein [Micrococcales bacterium 31B]|nr:VanW family protein [Micrococcales bacterium 31B]